METLKSLNRKDQASLCRLENSRALCLALDRLLSDAELRKGFSENGISDVRPRFEIKRHVEQLDALYTRALAS